MLSVAVINTMTENHMGRKGSSGLLYYPNPTLRKEVRTRTQAGPEAGNMEENCL